MGMLTEQYINEGKVFYEAIIEIAYKEEKDIKKFLKKAEKAKLTYKLVKDGKASWNFFPYYSFTHKDKKTLTKFIADNFFDINTGSLSSDHYIKNNVKQKSK